MSIEALNMNQEQGGLNNNMEQEMSPEKALEITKEIQEIMANYDKEIEELNERLKEVPSEEKQKIIEEQDDRRFYAFASIRRLLEENK